VTVVFLDRRDDPLNLSYHCYLTQSADGGATWSANEKISTVPSDPTFAAQIRASLEQEINAGGLPDALSTTAAAGLLGEYIGVTAWNGHPTPVWTDTRNGHQDVYAGYISEETPVFLRHFDARLIGETVRLEWDLAADEPILGFNVYRREGSGGLESLLNRAGLIPGVQRSFDDTDFEAGKSYEYALGVKTLEGSNDVVSQFVRVHTAPHIFSLGRSYPNPFQTGTVIAYEIPEEARVSLKIYDAEGRLVTTLVDRRLRPGPYEATWHGEARLGPAVASGIYFAVLESNGRVQTQKMILLR